MIQVRVQQTDHVTSHYKLWKSHKVYCLEKSAVVNDAYIFE